jgi:hypothetical protein
MATVRIYKVSELLNMPSQDVLELLKKNHGIELKSASSTLEEIVARQFVDRQAKQRGIELPKGDIFSETAVKSVKAKGGPARRPGSAPEPPKPTIPNLGPPAAGEEALAGEAGARGTPRWCRSCREPCGGGRGPARAYAAARKGGLCACRIAAASRAGSGGARRSADGGGSGRGNTRGAATGPATASAAGPPLS